MTARVISDNLHAFMSIVDYSRRTAAQQLECQEQLVRIIEHCLQEAGVRTDSISRQNQGGALLITFPVGTDVTKVLAALPRQASLLLATRNRDVQPPAWLRLIMSFAMGPTAPGPTGLTGQAPIEAVRLSAADSLRHALATTPAASVGIIITDDLYRKYVQQQFRPDLTPSDFFPVNITDQENGSATQAWVNIPDHPIGSSTPGRSSSRPATRRRRKSTGKPAPVSRRPAFLSGVPPWLQAMAALITALTGLIAAGAVILSGNDKVPGGTSPPGQVTPSGLPVQPARSASSHTPSQYGKTSQGNIPIPTRSSISTAVTHFEPQIPLHAPYPQGREYTLRDLDCFTLKGSVSPSRGTWILSRQSYNDSIAYGRTTAEQWFYCSFKHPWSGVVSVTQGIFDNPAADPGAPLLIGASILVRQGKTFTVWNMGSRAGETARYQIKMKDVTGFYLATNTCYDGCLHMGDLFVWGDLRVYM